MNTAQLINLILDNNLRIFSTADFIMLSRMKKTAAVKALSRLSQKGLVLHLRRGVWASKLVGDILPQEALPYLTSPWPSYVSLESALSEAGIVSQIPVACHGITLGKPLHVRTPLGEYRIHHMKKSLFGGYRLQRVNKGIYPLAHPEKALLDTLYIRYRLGGRPNFLEWDISILDLKRLKKISKPFPLSVRKLLKKMGKFC